MIQLQNTWSENQKQAISKEVRDKMDEIHLRRISYAEIPPLWDHIYPLMEKAEGLFQGRMAIKDLLHECMTQRMQMWLVGEDVESLEAVVITQIVEYPGCKAARYVLLSGSGLDHWLKGDDVITEWAKAQGCKMMEAAGRKGWATKLKPLGYKTRTNLYEKGIA